MDRWQSRGRPASLQNLPSAPSGCTSYWPQCPATDGTVGAVGRKKIPESRVFLFLSFWSFSFCSSLVSQSGPQAVRPAVGVHAAQAEGKDLNLSGESLGFLSGKPATTCLGVPTIADAPMLLGRQFFFFLCDYHVLFFSI